MARKRRTSRRRGRRTGAIEVPMRLFNRIWKDTRARFDLVPAAELSSEGPAEKLLAAVFGWDEVSVLRPVTERKLGSLTIALPRPTYDISVGTYRVPSARYGGKRLDLRVVLADPVKSRFYKSTSAIGAVAGHVEHDKDLVSTTKKRQAELIRAASKGTGIPVRTIRAARDEFELELCSLSSTLSLTIVLFVHFNKAVDKVGLRRIRDTLLHELTHAMDEEIRKPWQRYIARDNLVMCEEEVRNHFEMEPLTKYGKTPPRKRVSELPPTPSEEVLDRYYNLPREVTARLAQVWGHIRKPGVQDELAWELKDQSSEPMGNILLDWAWGIPPFRVMWDRLDGKNRRRVMRALADMAAPVLEAEAARRAGTVPNRRTSRRKTSQRRRSRMRRTSRNPRPRRTPAQAHLISELWGLVHRQEFLKSRRRPHKYLDERVERATGRLRRQGMSAGAVEWERLQAIQSAAHFGEM